MANFDDLLNNTPVEKQGGQRLSPEEYAAKKNAEREEAFALSDQTAMDISADGNTFQSFLNLQSRLNRYTAVNALLVFAQNPNASRLGDFDHWRDKNCSVKPGQKAIGILEPHAYTKEDGSPGTGYNVKKVFDISQVNTRKLRVPPASNLTERQLLSALINKAPVKIGGVDELPGELGAITDLQTGEISVRRGMSFSDTFKSLAQELCYAEVDQNAPGSPQFVSYCSAYLLCKKYGVDTQSFSFEDTADMFDGMSAQDIKGELAKIRDIAEDISGRMARQFEAAQKATRSDEAR